MQSYSESTTTLSAFMQRSSPNQDGDVFGDYWNIDDILAEEEMIPVVFKKEQNGLGYLTLLNQTGKAKKSATLQSIPEGQKVDLPVWLASLMATRGIVDLMRPLFLTEKYFKQLIAGAEVVTMHHQS